MKLTPKQEKFVQGLISGLSQREAYKQAGYSSNRANEQLDRDASVLFKNPKVFKRYQELQEEHKNKALWTKEQSIHDLIWLKEQAKLNITEIGVKQANSNAFLNAIKELNSLEDLYKKDTPEEEFEDDGFLAALDGKGVSWDEEA